MKTQMKLQKVLVILALAMMGISFVYALGYATPVYNLFTMSDPELATFVEGAELYAVIQPFNLSLYNLSIVGLVICAVFFVFFTQSRRIYYISNYIVTVIFSGFSIGVSFYAMSNISKCKDMFSTIDFVAYKVQALRTNYEFIESPGYYNLGFVIYIALILVALALLANLVWKTLLVIKERKQIALELASDGGKLS